MQRVSDCVWVRLCSRIFCTNNFSAWFMHTSQKECNFACQEFTLTYLTVSVLILLPPKAFPPSFTKHPLRSKMKAAIQGNATITCNPEGAPEPVTTWFKNGSPLSGDGNHVIVLPNGNLVIRNVQTSDQGVYMCRAENEFGKAESSGHLSIVCKFRLSTGKM